MKWFRPRVVIVLSPPLKEEELIKAYSIPANDLQYRATMQIIEEHVQEAHEKAEISSASECLPHFYNGGAEWLGRVRDKIEQIHQEALKRSLR